jgi:hypothetical protein
LRCNTFEVIPTSGVTVNAPIYGSLTVMTIGIKRFGARARILIPIIDLAESLFLKINLTNM